MEEIAPLELILVGAAETLESADMRTVVQATRLRVDPDGVLAADNRAHERRWFNFDQTFGGEWFPQGQFDAEGGALVKTLLDAITELPRPGDPRTASQRRADALVDLAAEHLRSGALPAVHGQRPHLTLTVSAETLRAHAPRDDSLDADADVDGRADGDARPADLQGVGPIHPETARRIACDAVKTEVTVAPPADDADPWVTTVTTPVVPLSVGRATRTIPVGHPHRALSARQRLPLPGMRPSDRVDRRPPHHPLGGRRPHRARQSRLPVPAAPPRGARAGMAHPHGGRHSARGTAALR